MASFEPPSTELRRAYHDRIAALKARSREVVDFAVKGSRSATLALLGQNRSMAGGFDSAAERMSKERRRRAHTRTDLSARLGCVGRATGDLLAGAAAAWAGLDPEASERVVAGAEGVRLLHLELLSSLVRLDRVPMEAALDLSMAARAFERLTDHAVEIAERVQFVAG